MDVLLISPDHGNKKNNFPWGILALGSYLKNIKNRDVELLDASLFKETDFFNELDSHIYRTQLIGIGCFTTDVRSVKKFADYIKKRRPEVKIIIGGPHAVLEPVQTCEYRNIDFVAYTEGEMTLDALIDQLSFETPDFDKVAGLIYKKHGKLIRTNPPECVCEYPINYDLLSPSVKKTFPDYIQVLTGRGCSYKCRFCYNSVIAQKFRPYSVVSVINELEDIVNRYNPKVVYFRDENFFQDKNRIYEFIRLYREKQFHFSWRATCRANYINDRYINRQLLLELEKINCETLKMGIESGSQRVLNYLKKGTHIEGIKKAVREVAKIKSIRGNYSFIVGLPEQTSEEYIETIDLIRYILKYEPEAEIIGPQYFRIYPGGSLYDEIVQKYNYAKPASFEDWAIRTDRKNDHFGLFKNVDYAWIPKAYKNLALHGDLLVLLYQKPISFYFSRFERIPALPFALLAKIRIRMGWYRKLYEIKLIARLLNIYRQYFPYK